MKKPSTYYVWDDPESKIQFLEETLHGKDWKVTVIYPDHDEASLKKRAEAKAELSARGYLLREGEDDCGHATLELHHLGEGTRPTDIVKEMGLVKGTMHMGSHPLLPLRYLLGAGQDTVQWVEKVMHDPAQANGFINSIAEIFLVLGGLSANQSKIKIDFQHGARNTSSHLQTLSGLLFWAQSLTYLFIAKNNEQVTLDHLRRKVDRIQDDGGDITDIRFDLHKDRPSTGIGHAVTSFLRRYPVQIGALFNDLGMIAYMGHATAEKKWKNAFLTDPHTQANAAHLGNQIKLASDYTKGKYFGAEVGKGYFHDMLGATLSLFAWPLLMIPRKEIDDKTREAHQGHPLAQFWDKLRENPETLAGVMTLGASGNRLLGAGTKDNKWQKAGEITYLGGDVALMMTKNDAYGSDNARQIDKLADNLAQYVRDMPVVMGSSAQKGFVHKLSNFLEQKMLAESAGDTEKRLHMTRADLDERSARLEQAVMNKLQPIENTHLQKLADAMNVLAARFPETARPQVVEKLTTAIGGLSWVHATPDELKAALASSIKPAQKPRQTQLVQMKDISKEVAELAFVIPGLDAGGTASAVHDALLPFIRSQQSDPHHLDQAMTTKAMGQLGMDPHMLSAAARSQSPAQGELNR